MTIANKVYLTIPPETEVEVDSVGQKEVELPLGITTATIRAVSETGYTVERTLAINVVRQLPPSSFSTEFWDRLRSSHAVNGEPRVLCKNHVCEVE
jgi:hypothetical protein